MWASLTKLYHNKNQNNKMVLKDKLRSIKMYETDTVATYLIRIIHIRDDLEVVGGDY